MASSNDDVVSNELKAVLSKVKVSDIPQPKEIIEFEANDSVIDSFTVLTSKRILSAPVFDNEKGEYIGFLDLRDLVSFVVNAEKSLDNRHASLKDIVAYVPQVAKADVTLSYLARRHRFVRVDFSATLFDVAKVLAAHKSHRVPVFKDGKIVNIVSQSSIIIYLAKHLKEMPHLAGMSVAQSHIGTSPVISCKADDQARHAFDVLEKTGRFGMAVIGENHSIITQTSAHDLKLWLNMPNSELFDLSILHFLQKIRAQDVDIQVPVLSCSEKDSLAFVILKLQATRSHRIFVLDAHFHPSKVISLSDVLRLLKVD